ncbi:ABC transporter substrate-binding protein [Pseudoroseomonas deserti]|uniref:ABC transporter substrate-binding protein n=1 Tax=Teichococcus deserti TaxID=1817963 RepID=A0A1V2H6U8_9PROT|nr:tripartite tricarboxylate transporter substrate binding protein [Pseudoroseomonas deserti]ONG56005.1 ABC transporter substrate-binding protein [Pseudoroseomonas deserti]
MTSFSRRTLLGASAGLAAAPLAAPALAQPRYPARPLQLICPWGAGGGTDATARIVAALLEKELGQPVNVVNRTGGSGVVGHAAIASANPDGYSIGIITVEIAMMHWQGLTELTHANYTPLGLVNRDAPGVQVSASSPYKDIKALAEGIKASPPGRLKASGTGQGGIWHLALVGWLQAMGLKPDHVRWVPSNGAAPGMQDLVAGGIDIVPCSIPEARAMLDAGRARSLAIMSPQRDPQFPDIPTLKESLGVDYQTAVWRGIGGPLKLPAEISARLTAALEKVYKSEQYAEFMKSRGFGMDWADGAGFGRVMAETDAAMGVAMKAAGLAKA